MGEIPEWKIKYQQYGRFFRPDTNGFHKTGLFIERTIESEVSQSNQRQLEKIKEIIWEEVEPCEPDCSDVRHALHEGQWSLATRLEKRLDYLTSLEKGEK
jgi:hypothetical protein